MTRLGISGQFFFKSISLKKTIYDNAISLTLTASFHGLKLVRPFVKTVKSPQYKTAQE